MVGYKCYCCSCCFLVIPPPPPIALVFFFSISSLLSVCCCCFCLFVFIILLITYSSLLTKSKMVQSISSRQPTTDSKSCGLRIGHVNVYYLFNKVQDVCMLLTKSPYMHLLGFSETRLNSCVGDKSLSIPSYTIFRRDAAHPGQTGMGLYIHKSMAHITKRRADLESEQVERVWVEVKALLFKRHPDWICVEKSCCDVCLV